MSDIPWFNPYGFAFVLILMVPNIVFAIKCREGFENIWHNKVVEGLEQVGRFGCFVFMFVEIPGTALGFANDMAFGAYITVDILLLSAYCLVWIVCFRSRTVSRALALSILPSALFLFSGIISGSVLLMVSAVIFAPCHITISYRNALSGDTGKR